MLLLVCATLLSACSSIAPTVFPKDPRCQPRQYCPYTDPPAAVRTDVLRSGPVYTDPAVR